MEELRMQKRVAVIGVGLMGSSLAKHLLAAGYPVTVHDIDAAKVEALVGLGARTSSTGRIAAEVDVIMLSLPNSHVVNEVVANALELFERGRKGQILVDASTADPDLSIALAARLREQGIEMLDATISGTSEMFAEKDAIFMVGGSEAAFRECEPLFRAAARSAYYMGANGTGAHTKLVVNLVLSLNRMALAEGLTLAAKAGLDPAQALRVLQDSAAASRAMEQKGERMVKRNFTQPASELSTSYKDARLILGLGAKLDCPLPLMSLYVQALASEISKGRKHLDPATIIQFYSELAGLRS
jgi:3-hydroxyisobutyrate dehydrogenase-like beta-hydroxyacid dehydrogenase